VPQLYLLTKFRITNRDVARHAGVSTAVVSYVVNNGPRATSPEVRERVLKAIQELDYHPNAVARGLRHQRTHTICFIANDYFPLDVFVSPYSAGILTGLIDHLKGAHQYLLVYPVAIGEDLTALELLLRSGRLDGVVVRLVQDPPATDALLNTIAATNVPCVCIERTVERYPFPSVTIDDRHGAYSAVEYLVGARSSPHRAHSRRPALPQCARAARNVQTSAA
jgi:LacI family transcriptional regulator